MKQQILAEARAKLKELSDLLAKLQKEYEEKVAQKEELERKSRLLQLKLERAEALITGLSGLFLFFFVRDELDAHLILASSGVKSE